MKVLVEDSLYKLIDYCEKEKFRGYDPYDLQDSFLPISKLPLLFQFAVSQVNKRSPVNFRSFLGIRKNYHSKAIGLLLSGYCNLYEITKEKKIFERIDFFLNWLETNRSQHVPYICWGFDYDYTSRNKQFKKGSATVVHHSYIIQALYKYWLLTDSHNIFELINNSKKFILKDIPISKYGDSICFGYHPGFIGCCYNASLHAAECLAIVDKINQKDDYFELIKNAVQYVVSRQKSSGEWYYSHGLNPEQEKKQIDFHQGFVLECLSSIDNLTGGRLTSLVKPSIQTGLEFYRTKQFSEQGQGVFRYPKKYPADIHNQAQGIITFSKFAGYDQSYEKMAESIIIWTIQNMQDSHGFFYYQKYRLFTNKISYMRWSQAWMFLALTEYLLMKKSKQYE